MVSLTEIRASNAQVATALRPGLVAVFAGATSGIGETSLKQFAKNAAKPRIYFIGRSKESGSRICTELKKLNPEGEYIYISADVSLLHSVDDVCREIKAKETAINLLFLTTGTMVSGKGEFVEHRSAAVVLEEQGKANRSIADTEEGLNYPVAVAYYARFRFIVNLLPLIQNATDLRRVVTVLAGTKEGAIDSNDFQARHIPMLSQRGHFTSMMTLSLEAVAQSAPTVSFVHDYPGFVKTNFGKDVGGLMLSIVRGILGVLYLVIGPFLFIPFDETGERHLFFATSARFPGAGGTSTAGGTAAGVPLPESVAVARGTDGKSGSGVYSISYDAESAPPKVEQLLDSMRKDGTAKKLWSHVEEEFVRITGAASI